MHGKRTRWVEMGLSGAVALLVTSGASLAQVQVQAPQPGVPEIYTIQGEFVRVAYNLEGYSSLGYRLANDSVGQEWMRLEIGLTLREGEKKDFTLKRDGLSLSTPDGKTLPMATNMEYRSAGLQALDMRANVIRDSINYFPPSARQACRIGFFAELDSAAMARDQVDLSWERACVGRIYFHVPGEIKHGQHFLDVQFANSKLRVPFRILTEEEGKVFSKSWEDIKKKLDEAWAEAARKK